MGRRKEQLTQDQLNDLAERAQDLAIEISNAADMVSPMSRFAPIMEPAAKIHQLIEAAGSLNRMLLALARSDEDRYDLERKLKAEA